MRVHFQQTPDERIANRLWREALQGVARNRGIDFFVVEEKSHRIRVAFSQPETVERVERECTTLLAGLVGRDIGALIKKVATLIERYFLYPGASETEVVLLLEVIASLKQQMAQEAHVPRDFLPPKLGELAELVVGNLQFEAA